MPQAGPRPALTVALALVFAAACDGSRRIGSEPEIHQPEPLLQTMYSGIPDVRRLTFRSESEWREFLDEIVAAVDDSPARAVDFSREVVLVATLGTQEDGGRRIRFGEAVVSSGEVIVDVVEIVPDPICDRIPVETTPLTAAALSLRPVGTRVRFAERTEIAAECP
jgi:hypothetical protein